MINAHAVRMLGLQLTAKQYRYPALPVLARSASLQPADGWDEFHAQRSSISLRSGPLRMSCDSTTSTAFSSSKVLRESAQDARIPALRHCLPWPGETSIVRARGTWGSLRVLA